MFDKEGKSFIFLGLIILQLICYASSLYDEEKFKKIVIGDNTNDDAIGLDTQQLLKRSGYDYEEYEVTANDGYKTVLIRIVNPLVERANLRYPPILIHHGANIDTSAYLLASSIQHHPEPFPRTAEDGPITSSNRSLGFTLSNNGYDVWLMPTRGSNKQNLGHTKNALGINVVHDGGNSANLTKGEIAYEYARTPFYWQYGQDDVLAFELKPQWDKVLEVTGSQEFSLYSYSLSTPTTLGFLAMHPDYASRVRVYFQMGPAIAASHFTGFDFTYFEIICNAVPTRGVGFTPTFIGNPLLRELFVDLSPSYEIRYTLLKEITRLIFGPSPKYQTNLERNALDKIFKPVSFKTVQQYCQNSVSKVFQKFNYGLGNLGIYGSVNPPAYNISYVDVQNYVIVNGEYDGLASPETVKHLISMVSARKPIEQIEAPQFNHLDLITGVECDKYVNLPVLETLNKYSN